MLRKVGCFKKIFYNVRKMTLPPSTSPPEQQQPPTTSSSKETVMIVLYTSMGIFILIILVVVVLMLNRRRKKKLIQSQSLDGGTTGGTATQGSANEMRQLQTELQRQHMKKQHADIEDIVKLQAKKGRRSN